MERNAELLALDPRKSILRNAFKRHGGIEVDTQGDAFFVAFAAAPAALTAAAEAQAQFLQGQSACGWAFTPAPLVTDAR